MIEKETIFAPFNGKDVWKRNYLLSLPVFCLH